MTDKHIVKRVYSWMSYGPRDDYDKLVIEADNKKQARIKLKKLLGKSYEVGYPLEEENLLR